MAIRTTFASVSDGDQLNEGYFNGNVKNVISMTESMIQATKLSADAGVTDISRSNAQVDVYSDSTGYNNTIDTGSSTASYDSTYDFYTAIKTTDSAESVSSISGIGSNGQSIDTILSITNSGWISSVVVKIFESGGSGGLVTVNVKDDDGTIVATKSYNGGIGEHEFTFTIGNYSKMLKTGSATIEIRSTLYKYVYFANNTASYSGTNFSYTSTDAPNYITGASNWLTFEPVSFSSGVLLTTSETFGFNLASCLVNAETSTPTGTSITVDVSSDGGSTYDVTGQSLREVLELDDDDTDLVLKFNLTTTDSAVTPTISSHAIQLFKES